MKVWGSVVAAGGEQWLGIALAGRGRSGWRSVAARRSATDGLRGPQDAAAGSTGVPASRSFPRCAVSPGSGLPESGPTYHTSCEARCSAVSHPELDAPERRGVPSVTPSVSVVRFVLLDADQRNPSRAAVRSGGSSAERTGSGPIRVVRLVVPGCSRCLHLGEKDRACAIDSRL